MHGNEAGTWTTFIAEMTERNRMFLTQVEIWWSVGVKVPEGVRPSPANTG